MKRAVKVSRRSYRLGRRAETVTQTRARIVASARELISEGSFHRIPIEHVAERAGVARATVYNRFGSKVGVLEAVIDDIERRARLPRILKAVELPDPIEALQRTLEEGCRYWADEANIARNVIGLAAADPEIQVLVERRDQQRLVVIERLVARLEEHGLLAPDCSRRRAVDVLWLLSSFEAFDRLFSGRGLSVKAVASLHHDVARRVLVAS